MLDVIITSTCRKAIVKTLESFTENVSSPEKFNFIVNIDVLHPEYLPRLLSFLKGRKITDITINYSPRGFRENHSKALSSLFKRIQTPFFFHLEDDWIFLKKVNLAPLIRLMQRYPEISHIRFSKERIRDKAWLYYLSEEITGDCLLPNIQEELDNILLVKTHTWSFNPSLARTSVIKHFVLARPKNCALQGADESWPLKYSASETSGFSPRSFIDLPSEISPEVYICRNYQKFAGRQGTYILGKIGDSPAVRDIGRNRLRQFLRKTKYVVCGGKYANYKF